MARYPWDQCMADQMKRYGSEKVAAKVCGTIRAQYGAVVEMPDEKAHAHMKTMSEQIAGDDFYRAYLLSDSSFSQQLNVAGDKGEATANALFDTGAAYSFISQGLAEKIATIAELPEPVTFTAADGKPIQITHCAAVTVDAGGEKMTDTFMVQPGAVESVILGAATMRKYGIGLSEARVTEALEIVGEPVGKKWEVRVIREGVSKKDFIYTRHALESLLPFVQGAKVLAIEVLPGIHGHASSKRTAGEQVGTLVNPRGVDVDGVYEVRADLQVKESWIDRLKSLVKTVGTGLSINAPVEGIRVKEAIVWVKKFLGLESVDLATVPSAGGGFLRATEAVAGEDTMKLEDILALLKKCKRDDLLTKLGATPTIEQAQEALESALAGAGQRSDVRDQRSEGMTAQEAQEVRALVEQTKKDSCDAYLTRKLTESNLPEPVKKKIEKQFAGSVFAREALDNYITAEKETLDQLAKSGFVNGAGETRIELSQEAVDEIQIALDKTLGVKVEGHNEIKPWRGIREAYVQITGDSEVRGYLPKAKMRAQEAIIAADFPNLLGTSVNRRLLADYQEADYGEQRIISQPFLTLDNFKLQEGERVGYFGDLDDVDPEAADYAEAAKPDEEKVSFTPIQKGNLLTLSRKAILNDDLRGLTKRVQGWGRAARRTLARFVWNFFINNSTYTADSTAWFTAGGGSHGNLVATSLSAANLSAAVDILAKMTELTSGERLGLAAEDMTDLLLVVPQELRATAYKINQAQYLDNNFTPNDLYQMFGAKNENILVNPLMTDATDWGLFRDPTDLDIIVMGFINGQQEPEIFIADQPTIGQMFVADKIQYKIRHEYGAMIGDYRGAVKSENP